MSSKILTRVLAANAGFSAVSGITLIVGAAPLARWLGIPTWLAIAIGFGLLMFAFIVGRASRDPKQNTVLHVILADVAWVIGAGIVIVGFPQSMSAAGLWTLGLVTVAVADFAALQAWGLRRSQPT